MKFRYDIGFLRAFSVLIVVFFHFKIPFFSGGFLGVDIFFVISGFLMTKIILSGLSKGTFSFVQFYLKRAKRILPALLLLLVFVLIVSVTLFLPEDLRLNSKYVFLSPIFLTNVYFWLYTGYFDPASQTNILLHTWSLSVEWQFYMLYPVLLWPLRKIYLSKRKLFVALLIVFTLISFSLMLALTKDYNSFTFYMFPTRAWEMTFGGLAAVLAPHLTSNKLLNQSKRITVICSYVILIICTVLINEQMVWPSYLTIIPVIAVFLILYLNVDSNLLENKIIQFIGNISYSLYLWHWSLYIVFMYFGLNSPIYIGILIVLSFSFATGSYLLVEKKVTPINLKILSLNLFIILVLSAVLFFNPSNKIVEYFSIYDQKLINSFSNVNQNSEQWKSQFNPCDCFITRDLSFADYNEQKCLKIDSSKKNILLIGDSHAAQLSASLREQLSADYHVSEASASYAFPFLNTVGMKDSKFLINKVFNEFIVKNYHNIDVVLISTHWLMYNNFELGYSKAELGINMMKTVNYLQAKNIKVVIVGQTESYSMPYPKIKSLSQTFGESLDERYLDLDGFELNNYFKSIFSKEIYLDVYNTNKIKKFDSANGRIYMFDDNHLSKYGADQIVSYIIPNIK